jgi:DNA-directed RNA polymerase alpha subunit
MQKLVVSPATNSSEGTTVSKETSPDLKVYFNGTVENPNKLNCNLKSGDNLQVNFIIPSAHYTSGTLMGLAITSQKEYDFTQFSLP